MQTCFSFYTEQSLRPVWYSDPYVSDVETIEPVEVKTETIPIISTQTFVGTFRPVFDSLIRCAQLGDGAGITIRHRTLHSLELDIYDTELLYRQHQAYVQKSPRITMANRIKSFRRFFAPMDATTRWTINTRQISIKLKTDRAAHIAYRDALRRYPFKQ